MISLQSINHQLSDGFFLLLIVGIPVYGLYKRRPVYEDFIDGAKEGLQISFNILPFLVAMLVAIGMFRASGGMDMLAGLLAYPLSWLGIPPEVLPLAIIRPFSGSAANGVMASIIQEHGGNAFLSKLAAVMVGSTETTFYVVALYFGAAKITQTRHAIGVGLLADCVGIWAAVIVARWFFIT